jgi:hypothetical protein
LNTLSLLVVEAVVLPKAEEAEQAVSVPAQDLALPQAPTTPLP